MKFIFPKNYSFKYKLLGFIDYSTAIADCIIGFLLYFVIGLFTSSLTTRIYIFIIVFFPFVLFSILGLGRENLISVVFYMYSFFKTQKIYLYDKKKAWAEKSSPHKKFLSTIRYLFR